MPRKKAETPAETFRDGPALPLKNYDVMVVFEDGTEEIVKVHAKHPLAAIGTARYTPEREWPEEKLLCVRGAYIVT